MLDTAFSAFSGRSSLEVNLPRQLTGDARDLLLLVQRRFKTNGNLP